MSIILYACESWTLAANIERRIQAVEIICFQKQLRSSYRDHITNEEVKSRLKNNIELYEGTLKLMKFSEKTQTQVVWARYALI